MQALAQTAIFSLEKTGKQKNRKRDSKIPSRKVDRSSEFVELSKMVFSAILMKTSRWKLNLTCLKKLLLKVYVDRLNSRSLCLGLLRTSCYVVFGGVSCIYRAAKVVY